MIECEDPKSWNSFVERRRSREAKIAESLLDVYDENEGEIGRRNLLTIRAEVMASFIVELDWCLRKLQKEKDLHGNDVLYDRGGG